MSIPDQAQFLQGAAVRSSCIAHIRKSNAQRSGGETTNHMAASKPPDIERITVPTAFVSIRALPLKSKYIKIRAVHFGDCHSSAFCAET
jgi:hypothetical protein